MLYLRVNLSTSKPSISSCQRLAQGVLRRSICTRLSSLAVGRTFYISFLIAIPLIITSLPTPIVGRLAVEVLVGGKGAALGAGAKVGVEDDIAVASIRFKLVVELNIYSEPIERRAYC